MLPPTQHRKTSVAHAREAAQYYPNTGTKRKRPLQRYRRMRDIDSRFDLDDYQAKERRIAVMPYMASVMGKVAYLIHIGVLSQEDRPDHGRVVIVAPKPYHDEMQKVADRYNVKTPIDFKSPQALNPANNRVQYHDIECESYVLIHQNFDLDRPTGNQTLNAAPWVAALAERPVQNTYYGARITANRYVALVSGKEAIDGVYHLSKLMAPDFHVSTSKYPKGIRNDILKFLTNYIYRAEVLGHPVFQSGKFFDNAAEKLPFLKALLAFQPHEDEQKPFVREVIVQPFQSTYTLGYFDWLSKVKEYEANVPTVPRRTLDSIVNSTGLIIDGMTNATRSARTALDTILKTIQTAKTTGAMASNVLREVERLAEDGLRATDAEVAKMVQETTPNG